MHLTSCVYCCQCCTFLHFYEAVGVLMCASECSCSGKINFRLTFCQSYARHRYHSCCCLCFCLPPQLKTKKLNRQVASAVPTRICRYAIYLFEAVGVFICDLECSRCENGDELFNPQIRWFRLALSLLISP